MRLESVRIEEFGASRFSLSLSLAPAEPARRLAMASDRDAAWLVEAMVWGLRGGEAELSAETEVELAFECAGRRARVLRRARDGREGTGTSEVLGWEAGAEEAEPTARGESELGAWLDGLGLPSRATLRLALLAQARALGASLEAGEPLAAESLPKRSAELGRLVEDRLDHLLVEIESRADALRLERAEALATAAAELERDPDGELALEDLGERLEETRVRLEAARRAAESLSESAEQTRRLITTATARQERLEALESARQRLREVERREPESRRWRRELDRAERAAALEGAESELTEPEALEAERLAAAALRAARRLRDEAAGERETAELRRRHAELASEALEAARARWAELQDLEGVLSLLGRTREALAAGASERERQQERRAELAARHADLGARAAASERSASRARAALGDEGSRQLAELHAELAEAEIRVAAARRLAEAQDRRREVTRTHATTMIHLDRTRRALEAERRQLARRLSGDSPVGESAELEAQRRRVAGLESDAVRLGAEEVEQDEAVQRLGAEVLRLRQELGTLAYAEAGELEAEAKRLKECVAEAGAPAAALARAESQCRQLEAEAEATLDELQRAEADLTAARAREDSERDLARELESRVPAELREAGALPRALESAATRVESMETELAASREQHESARAKLEGAEARLAEAAAGHAAASAILDRSQAELAELVRRSGFSDLADFRDGKRSPEERLGLGESLRAWEEELGAARERHRELEGLTNVPVLREADRRELDDEDWVRRQRERKERLQADRVHRDRATLDGLLAQLEAALAAARAEEERHERSRRALERVEGLTSGFADTLRELRERHAALTRMADLAAGRAGPTGGFAAFLAAALGEEAAARAGQWCRELTGGEWQLSIEPEETGAVAELREVLGGRRTSLAGAAPEERWLAGLCLALGRADALLALEGAERPGLLVTDRLPTGLGEAPRRRLEAWLRRLEATGRLVLAGLEEREAPRSSPLVAASRRAATGQAG